MIGYRRLSGHYKGGIIRQWLSKRCALWSILSFLLFSVILFEELHFGLVFTTYMSSYSLVILVEPREIVRGDHNVSIVVFVKDGNLSEYSLAQETLRCYAQMHGYQLHLIKLSQERSLLTKCGQNQDFMFLRHCALAYSMEKWPDNEWILFVDADMGVINPDHQIEDFLPKSPDSSFIIFYKRIMNHEIMAGSYLIKNTKESRLFLLFWSNYEKRLPKSFHGSDNGAIHSVVAEWALATSHEKERKTCEILWFRSKNYDDLSDYTVCMQNLIGKHPLKGIKILPKGRHAWARDGWLTENLWSEHDFFLHGWQKRRKDRVIFGRWHSPLIWNGRKWGDCKDKNAFTNWRYKDTFVSTRLETDRRIQKVIDELSNDYEKRLKQLQKRAFIRS